MAAKTGGDRAAREVDLKRGLRGIITVLNTPFDSHGAVDLDALGRHVEYAIRSGVVGILVPAMASEVGSLSDAERAAILERVVLTADGRVAIVGGASASNRRERVKNVRLAIEAGCDVVLVAIDYADEAQYRDEIHALAEVGPPALMIQDWDFHGYGAPVATIAKAFDEVPCFLSIKIEVVPAGPKYSEVLRATGGRMHVAGGWAVSQMIEALDRGVDAFMPTALHEVYVAIYERYVAGNRVSAQSLFYELLPVLAFSNQHLDVSIRFFKRLLWRQGIYPTDRCRDLSIGFDEIADAAADEMIQRGLRLIEGCIGSERKGKL